LSDTKQRENTNQHNIKEKPIKTKDEYIEGLAAELKEWSAQINLLTAKTENAAAHMKLKYAEELDALRAKQHAAAEKLKELQETSGDAWGTVKETADKVWDDLRTGLASAVSKFK
jgi:chromosome segregation ATPase